MTDYARARENMVDSQLRTNRVRDLGLLDAFETVPRERFVPEGDEGFAYIDEDLPLGGGRYLMEPMVLARLIQAADISAHDVVLDIGCATGYSSAILSHMADAVVALESNDDFRMHAENTLQELGVDNVAVVAGGLKEGYPDQAPYDVIVLAGAVAEVPQAIKDQLADGGRMVTVVRESGASMGQATLFRRAGAVVSERSLFDAATPLLPIFAREPGFVF